MKTTIIERIKELVGNEANLAVEDFDEFTYSVVAGYEKLTVTKRDEGTLEFAGAYHPNVICEGEGVCKHCGRTLNFDQGTS